WTGISTLQACAPQIVQKIIVQRLFHAPHRCTAMFDKTVESAQFSQGAQFVLCERHMPLQIVQRLEWPTLPLFKELFNVFLAQSVYDAKSETNSFADPHRRFASASRRSSLVAIPT